jgi:hypothetical protein
MARRVRRLLCNGTKAAVAVAVTPGRFSPRAKAAQSGSTRRRWPCVTGLGADDEDVAHRLIIGRRALCGVAIGGRRQHGPGFRDAQIRIAPIIG